MIVRDSSIIDSWAGKIVYMPNGGGKTTSANYIKEELSNSSDLKVGLFTRRDLEDLISVGDPKSNEVYFGLDAANVALRDKLEKEISEKAPLSSFIKKNYSETSAARAREKSFYCDISIVKSLNDKPTRFKKPSGKVDIDFNKDGIATELDKVLKKSIYDEARKIIDVCKETESLKIDWDPNIDIPNDYQDEIMDLYFYCVIYKVKTCLLCGHTYKGPNALKERMDEHIGKLTFSDSSTISRKILLLADKIYSCSQDSDILKAVFPLKARSIKACYRDIKMYKRICELTLYYVSRKMTDIVVDNDRTIDDCLLELEKVKRTIERHSSNVKRVKRFNEYLKKQIQETIDLPSSISVDALADGFGLSFKIRNKKINPYEILSESESKRFALIALKAEIHFGKIDALILDDPIDSYDDYNKIVCIKYINSFFKMSKLKKWYVLTNDFETVFELSKLSKKNVKFYLPDFDVQLGGQGLNKYIEKECNHREVELISQNEIYYFAKIVGEKESLPFNYEMMLASLILSCRNFNSEVITKLTRVFVNKARSGVSVDANWGSDVRERIVARLEHYIPPFHDSTFNSFSVTYGDVCDCFSRLAKTTRSFPALNIGDLRPFYDVRKNLCQATYTTSSDYGTIMNYVCKKMIIVSHAKFTLEEKLVNIIENSYGQTAASQVVNTKMLGPKIDAALSIDSSNGNKNRIKLRKIAAIHKKYSIIYNLFDHGLIQQISPYLPASTKDIANFYNDVNNI